MMNKRHVGDVAYNNLYMMQPQAENGSEAEDEEKKERLECMSDIEWLEKFIRQRMQWRGDVGQGDSDLRHLQRICDQGGSFGFLMGIALGSVAQDLLKGEPLGGIFAIVLFASAVISCVELSKLMRIREIFDRYSIQNASDLIDEFKKRNANQPQQNKPAS